MTPQALPAATVWPEHWSLLTEKAPGGEEEKGTAVTDIGTEPKLRSVMNCVAGVPTACAPKLNDDALSWAIGAWE